MAELNQSDKIVIGCCAGAAVLCFLPWYSVSVSGANLGPMAGMMQGALKGASANAFDSTEGTLAFIAALGGGGLVFADKSGVLSWDRKVRLLAPFIACVVSALCMLIFMTRGGGGMSGSMGGISAGRTFWFYIALVSIGAAAFYAFTRWQAGLNEPEPAVAGDATPPAEPPPPPPSPPAAE